jgi:two-component system chemotaxis response regulator CheY
LYVDDSRAAHAFVRGLFSETAHELADASSCADALDRIREAADRGFDLILLDWEMPVVSGPEFLAIMAQKNIRIPVIMITGKNNPSDIAAALRAGATEYIMKPFDRDLLFGKIEMAIGVKA